MPIVWESEFELRKKEIERYFGFLNGVADDPAFDPELQKTLKATAFLLLYNIVEASMRSALTAIIDELRAHKISFDDASAELRKLALNRLRSKADTKLHEAEKIAVQLLTVSFNADELFAGNIDARRIRDTALDYGFSSSTERALTRDGADLLTVKTARNDLGHGLKSFAEVGREYSAEELHEIMVRVLAYLNGILENIGFYIQSRQYLKVTKASP
jgi:hypothetical protein